MNRYISMLVLHNLEFVVNLKKSIPQPSQQMEFLGLMIDASQMIILFTQETIQKVIKHCQEFHQNSQTRLLMLTKLIALY